MSPLNEQQLGQLRDERREQIKKAALKVFARRGIAGTKMSMIAAEVGISQGLSYRYFSSKDELFIELVQEAMEEMNHAFEHLAKVQGSPIEQIRALTEAMLDESNKDAFNLIQQTQKSDEVPEKAKEIVGQNSANVPIDQLIPIFIKGQQMGEFCPGDPQKLLFCYLSIITGLMLLDVPTDEGYWKKNVDIIMKIITK